MRWVRNIIYPTGQNDSLELMFVKFATAKNRKKLNTPKDSRLRCYLSENNTEDMLNCSTGAPQLGFKPPTFVIQIRLRVLHSMIKLHSHLFLSQKILRLFANHLFCEYWERTIPSRIFVPCNLSSCRVDNKDMEFFLIFIRK